jgi:hypothetical protein
MKTNDYSESTGSYTTSAAPLLLLAVVVLVWPLFLAWRAFKSPTTAFLFLPPIIAATYFSYINDVYLTAGLFAALLSFALWAASFWKTI